MTVRKVHYFGQSDHYRENNITYESAKSRFPQATARLLSNWRSRTNKVAKCDPSELLFWITVQPVSEFAPDLGAYKQVIVKKSSWSLHASHSRAKLSVSSSFSEIKNDEKVDPVILAHLEAIAVRHWSAMQASQNPGHEQSEIKDVQLELCNKITHAEQQCRNILGDFSGRESSEVLNGLLERILNDPPLTMSEIRHALIQAKAHGITSIQELNQKDTAVLNTAVAILTHARAKL